VPELTRLLGRNVYPLPPVVSYGDMGMSIANPVQATYAPAQALLTLLQERLSGEVAAIHAAALELLSGQQGPAPGAVRMSINVEPKDASEQHQESPAATYSASCWDHTYACGKSESGYIMCTVQICMYT
jgi:hypothetical protein